MVVDSCIHICVVDHLVVETAFSVVEVFVIVTVVMVFERVMMVCMKSLATVVISVVTTNAQSSIACDHVLLWMVDFVVARILPSIGRFRLVAVAVGVLVFVEGGATIQRGISFHDTYDDDDDDDDDDPRTMIGRTSEPRRMTAVASFRY